MAVLSMVSRQAISLIYLVSVIHDIGPCWKAGGTLYNMMVGPPNYILLPFTGAIYKAAAATAVVYINSIHSTTVHTLTIPDI